MSNEKTNVINLLDHMFGCPNEPDAILLVRYAEQVAKQLSDDPKRLKALALAGAEESRSLAHLHETLERIARSGRLPREFWQGKPFEGT